ncbi:MAG: winged helix-turn-helix transcriptional regulator [Faecousia sp.]
MVLGDRLGGKWRTYVLYVLYRQGPCWFGELIAAIPKITSTMLSATLEWLKSHTNGKG